MREVEPKSSQQNRLIWGLAGQLGLSEEELRDVVEAVTYQRKISALTKSQAGAVIERLHGFIHGRGAQKRTATGSSAWAPQAQVVKIRNMAALLGWDLWKLRGWLKKYLQCENETWLKAGQATRAVQGLQSMLYRKEAQDGKDHVSVGRG